MARLFMMPDKGCACVFHMLIVACTHRVRHTAERSGLRAPDSGAGAGRATGVAAADRRAVHGGAREQHRQAVRCRHTLIVQ